MPEEIAIRVDEVSKSFVLPHEKVNSLKSAFTSLAKGGKRHKEVQHALGDISFEIKKGEFFGIVGRNGSGKSTLLKILAGIYQPSSGKVYTAGRLVPFIELGVGFNMELTGRENVFLNGAMLGFSESEVAAMYDDIVAFAELERFMDQKLKNYSSGMQVRLAFSMATRAEADILLVDEVLAVGDADFQNKCFAYFKRLKREKKTVVFVSHDMNAIREYCDRALLVDDSRLVTSGAPSMVAGEYSKLFLDEAAAVGTGKKEQQDRWGEGQAKIDDPIVKRAGGEVELKFSIQCKTDIDDPIAGYSFTNEQGQEICGTNTQIQEHELSPMRAGQHYEISFRMTDIFADGKYSATLALLANNGATVVDWWVNPVQLHIKKAQHVPYIVDVPITITSKEVK